MSQPSDRDLLIETNTTTKEMYKRLFDQGGAIPVIQDWQSKHDESDNRRFAAINETLSSGKGAVKVLIILWVTLGAGVLLHIIFGAK